MAIEKVTWVVRTYYDGNTRRKNLIAEAKIQASLMGVVAVRIVDDPATNEYAIDVEKEIND